MVRLSKLGILSSVLLAGFLPLMTNAIILRTLKPGDRGDDVRELQIILNKDADTKVADSGPGSPGNETNYYGSATKKAVIRFQEKYSDQILKPVGLSAGTGIVGSQTRLFLLQLENGTASFAPSAQPAQIPKALPPKIISVSPDIVTKATMEMIVIGSGFTSSGNSVIVSSEDQSAFTNLESADGKTIKFPFHFSNADLLKSQLGKLSTSPNFPAIISSFSKNIQERVSKTGNAQIPVRLLVRNTNGDSETFQILIDITEILKEIGAK